MKKIALGVLAAASLWSIAPIDTASALDVDGYVCRVNFDAVDGYASYVFYSGPNCSGTNLGLFQPEAVSTTIQNSLLTVLMSAGDRRVSVHYRRIPVFSMNLVQSVVVHSD
jgi:hypothetical protein